jgi:hypothetical protein
VAAAEGRGAVEGPEEEEEEANFLMKRSRVEETRALQWISKRFISWGFKPSSSCRGSPICRPELRRERDRDREAERDRKRERQRETERQRWDEEVWDERSPLSDLDDNVFEEVSVLSRVREIAADEQQSLQNILQPAQSVSQYEWAAMGG